MAKKIAIMGAGSWGTALAVSLSHAGHQVNMWDINAEHIAEMRANRENKRYLPGVMFEDALHVVDTAEEAIGGADIVLFSAPAQHFRSALQSAMHYLTPDMVLVNVAKGIEQKTLLRLSLDADGTAISRLDALRVNANVLLGKRSYQLLIAAAALFSLLAGLHGAHRHGRIALRREVLVLLLPLAAGVLWFLVLANHTYQHYYFAYRTLTVSFFALYALLTLLPAARTAPAAAQPVPKEDAP